MNTLIDQGDLIVEMVMQQLVLNGYSKKKNGEDVPDEDAMKQKVYDLVTAKVVSIREEKSKKAYTPGELYAAVFPSGPGADRKQNRDLLSAEEEVVRDKLVRKAWNLTNPARTGYIQKRLGQHNKGVVLCRAEIARGLDSHVGCFVTDNDDLILNDSLQPQIESLVNKANALRLHSEMIGERRPQLEARMNSALGLGVRRTVAALPSIEESGADDGQADS
jgi:hypothetical protein